jgi:hypothetical protein
MMMMMMMMMGRKKEGAPLHYVCNSVVASSPTYPKHTAQVAHIPGFHEQDTHMGLSHWQMCLTDLPH